ncbi:nuclear transport factor 2 family protein [Undibacterium sp. JH2W]|uniref:nuclear transport factor 2 family protein n=1 Tax=Undibacterium sp. JH2W TaxID=3413037 RepID=UPI003BEF5657
MLKKHLGKAALFMAIFCLGLLSAQAADSRDEKSAALVSQLTKLSDDWDIAIVRKDKAAIEANMAEDFRQIDGDGDLETKTSFVNGLMSDKLEIDPYKVEDFEVRLYGNVALLSGRTNMTGRYEGKPFVSHYRYIDIYVQRDGKWQIASVQISKIPQQ